MNTQATQPKIAVIFDVNLLIDAVDPQSAFKDFAQRSLSGENSAQQLFVSDTMLTTLAHRLHELGADINAVDEYVEFLLGTNEWGADIHLVRDVPKKSYPDLLDKFGKPDREDETVVALRDTVEFGSGLPVVLVTNDRPLATWCRGHARTAIQPNDMAKIVGSSFDSTKRSTLEYIARRMFADGNTPPSVHLRRDQFADRLAPLLREAEANRKALAAENEPAAMFDFALPAAPAAPKPTIAKPSPSPTRRLIVEPDPPAAGDEMEF
ncbi:MAG TPA: hypothetical protein VFU07_05490 [Candidatus Lumbricidophila sp.]|nr:hypothetical protein [Candidatus Lumbricidophila sp.]